MSLEYIREHYHVPAHRGKRVAILDVRGHKTDVTGLLQGHITSAPGTYIRGLLDGETKSKIYHPPFSKIS